MMRKTDRGLSNKNLLNTFVELIRRASSDLPVDVVTAIKEGLLTEKRNSIAYKTLQMILKNIKLAKEKSLPMCQDTGTPVFYVTLPNPPLSPFVKGGCSGIRGIINQAIKESVHKLYLRPNIVDTLTGKNLGDRTGPGYPVINFEEWEKDYIKVILMLKGAGVRMWGHSMPFQTAESMRGGIWKESEGVFLMQFIRHRGGDVRREF